MKENKMSAGHLNAYFGIRDSLNKFGLAKFGFNNIVSRVLEYQVYLDSRLIELNKLSSTEIKKAFVNYLREQPEVSAAFHYDNFQNIILPVKIKEMITNGYNYKRSGDIQFILKPNYTDVNSMGAEHGTIYNYDTHIPLVWYGWKVRPGKTSRETYMTDIAPTSLRCCRFKCRMEVWELYCRR